MAQYCPDCKRLVIEIADDGDNGKSARFPAGSIPSSARGGGERTRGDHGFATSPPKKRLTPCPQCGWPKNKQHVGSDGSRHGSDLFESHPLWPDFGTGEWARSERTVPARRPSYATAPTRPSGPSPNKLALICIGIGVVPLLLIGGFLLVCKYFFPGWLTYTVLPWLHHSGVLVSVLPALMLLQLLGDMGRRS